MKSYQIGVGQPGKEKEWLVLQDENQNVYAVDIYDRSANVFKKTIPFGKLGNIEDQEVLDSVIDRLIDLED